MEGEEVVLVILKIGLARRFFFVGSFYVKVEGVGVFCIDNFYIRCVVIFV